MNTMELYVPIRGFPNYEISTFGNVRNAKTGKMLSQFYNKGYCRVMLYNNGAKKNIFVHQLVAQHFISNPNEYAFVDHIDRNKLNNHIDNLRWVSYSDNMKNTDCTKKWDDDYIISLLIRYKNGESKTNICKTCDMPHSTADNYLSGKIRIDLYNMVFKEC